MLTKEQKIMLEEEIYKIATSYITEKKQSKPKKEKQYRKRKNTILNWLDDDTVNKAAIAYELYLSDESEKASDRSKFYKKINDKKYHFSNSELNKIASIMGK